MQQKLGISRYKNKILLQIFKENWSATRQCNDEKNMTRNRGSEKKQKQKNNNFQHFEFFVDRNKTVWVCDLKFLDWNILYVFL